MIRTWKLVWLPAAAALGLAIMPFTTTAATKADAGLALAQKYCVECHIVDPSASRGWTDAPAFEALANRPGMTVAFLSAVIEKPHMKMLNTGRPPSDAQAIAAYIMTLHHS